MHDLKNDRQNEGRQINTVLSEILVIKDCSKHVGNYFISMRILIRVFMELASWDSMDDKQQKKRKHHVKNKIPSCSIDLWLQFDTVVRWAFCGSLQSIAEIALNDKKDKYANLSVYLCTTMYIYLNVHFGDKGHLRLICNPADMTEWKITLKK